MRICIVNSLFPPIAYGGAETVVQMTIELLVQAGHQVVFITTHPDKLGSEHWTVTKASGYTTYRFRPKNVYYYTDGSHQPVWKKLLWHGIDIFNPSDGRILRDILAVVKPDLVHGHNLKGMSYTLPGICSRLGIPYVHTLHNYQLLHPYGTFLYNESPPFFRPKIAARVYQLLNRYQFSHVSHVISPSQLPVDLHRQAGFFRNTPTSIIPSPVQEPLTRPQTSSNRSEVGFVYLGALDEHKGIHDLVKAVQGLPSSGWFLDIYGTGAAKEGLQQQLRHMKQVRWMGYLQDKSVLERYDALIYPSRCYETQGLAMAEALMVGTPVIAANIGSIPETVQDGINGYLFPVGQVSALTKKLQSCITHYDGLRTLRPKALESAKRFKIRDYQTALLRVYETHTA